MNNPDFMSLTLKIHAANVKAGWWTDIKTGESILQTRNRPEMLMLAVSEIAEAAQGISGQMDDKLPHLPMYDVELADFVIRQFDQIGAEVSCGQFMPHFIRTVPRSYFIGKSRIERLMELVKQVSGAMEHYRKGRVSAYVQDMAEGITMAFEIARIEEIDLLDMINQKRAFNATRADHKVENRVKDGGKAF